MTAVCYLVGTPIGNLKDITLRALETLKSVDVIFAEDTRHTRQLLTAYDIKKPLKSYHQHKEREGADEIMQLLREGKSVALVSDAGMPAISDPGAMLVATLRQNGFEVTSCPSATAVTTAVALSGMSERGFAFYGFLPQKNKDREALICEIMPLSVPVVLYSAPHDVKNDLAYLASKLGNRQAFVIKELTKMFETAYVGRLGEIEIADPRGEFVLLIAPDDHTPDFSHLTIKQHFDHYIALGMDKKDAIKAVATARNVPKNQIYNTLLQDKN